MVKVTVTVHPKGLGPKEAAKAWYMRTKQRMKWGDIRKKVKTLQGRPPDSEHAVMNAVQRMVEAGRTGLAETHYANCGRRYGPHNNNNVKYIYLYIYMEL